MASRGLVRLGLLLALGAALGGAAEAEAEAAEGSQEEAADASVEDEPAEAGAEGDDGTADAGGADQGQGTGGPDLSRLQDSLRQGGVEGLNKMLKSIQSMGALHSDASTHIKKDAAGRDMYDFRDVNAAASPRGASADTTDQARTAAAGEQERGRPAARQPPAAPAPRAGAVGSAAAAAAAVQAAASAESEDGAEGAEGADGDQEGGSEDADAQAVAAAAVAAAARSAPAAPAAAVATAAPSAPAAPASAAASAAPLALAESAAATVPAAPVAAAAPVVEHSDGGLAPQQRPESEVDLLMRGVLALRQSADELIRQASSRSSPGSTQVDAAAAQNDPQKQMLLRLDALEKENGEMRRRLDEQSRELVGVEAAERRDQEELQEARKDALGQEELAAGQQGRNASLRGPAASGAHVAVAGSPSAPRRRAAGRARRPGRVRVRGPAHP